MRGLKYFHKLKILALLFCLASLSANAQQAEPQGDALLTDEDETIRISTELIQTGIAVLDKQGRFVDSLKQDDFLLRVDGKELPISFFERVTPVVGDAAAKDRPERPQLSVEGSAPTAPPPGRRARTVIFFVDDMHLGFESHKLSRDMMLRFIEQDMELDDLVAIISTSGRVGFLQQFTSNKAVLRAAIERLRYNKDNSASERQYPPMNEYEALLIDRSDRDVTEAFVSIYLAEKLATDRDDAELQILSRSRAILQQAAATAKNTYATLEQTVRKSAQISGRKIFFFISDGFFLDTANTDSTARLNRIADAAARANAVIYSFDAKGLDADPGSGVTGRLYRVKAGERWDQQDPLSAIAETTGGRFTRSSNDLRSGVTKALAEASTYYLLAWRPDAEKRGPDKLRRIEVSIKGRPELQVRVHSGYLDAARETASGNKQSLESNASTASTQLQRAFTSIVPRRALPTAVAVNYINSAAAGDMAVIALRIKGDALQFTDAADNRRTASIDLVGAIFNAQGKREDFFRNRLTVDGNSGAKAQGSSDIFYNHQVKLKPGIYQIRVAARDEKSGLAGSAAEWIEIPDLSRRRLTLSSLLVGEKTTETRGQGGAPAGELDPLGVTQSVDRSFAASSSLRYVLFIYNASATGRGEPDLSIKTEVLRDKQPVMASAESKITVSGQDPVRLPYAAEVPLKSLSAGRYLLRVTVTDRAAKTTASQQVVFEIK